MQRSMVATSSIVDRILGTKATHIASTKITKAIECVGGLVLGGLISVELVEQKRSGKWIKTFE